jgi:hypothetical protein
MAAFVDIYAPMAAFVDIYAPMAAFVDIYAPMAAFVDIYAPMAAFVDIYAPRTEELMRTKERAYHHDVKIRVSRLGFVLSAMSFRNG